MKRTKTVVHKCTKSTEKPMSPDFENINSAGRLGQNCKNVRRLNFYMSHFSDFNSSFEFGELILCLKVSRVGFEEIHCCAIS